MSYFVNYPPVVLNPTVQELNQETRDIEKELQKTRDIEKRFESIAKEIGDGNGNFSEIEMAVSTLKPNRCSRTGLYSNGIFFSLPEESFVTVMKFLLERIYRIGLQKICMVVLILLQQLQFGETPFSSAFLEYVLKWLEGRWEMVRSFSPQRVACQYGPNIIKILNNLLVCDMERSRETRIVMLFWNHAGGVSEHELVCWLNKIAKHYSSNIHEAGSQEKYLKTDEERASFLHACSIADTDKTSFYNDVNGALNQTEAYGQIARRWAEKEENLRTKASSCKSANALLIDSPKIEPRLNTAKRCLDRLDFAKKISADLNSYMSDTSASVMDTVMSRELTSLNALKKETNLPEEVVHQLKKINEKHRQAYEAVKKQQFERLEEIFQARQKEVEDVVREAMYKKEKYMASVAEETIRSDVNLTAEVYVLKGVVQQVGGALKTAKDKLEAHRLEKERNSECAVCFMEFTKKRKRACLDPCGHVNACFSCATKAWKSNPNCPLCRVPIEKPIPLPAQLFF